MSEELENRLEQLVSLSIRVMQGDRLTRDERRVAAGLMMMAINHARSVAQVGEDK